MSMPGSAMDNYEDMFKEITRKLYGEDGLPEITNTDRHSSIQERGLTPIDYDVDNPLLKTEEHITAFGLAALMQNGFPPTGILNSTFQQCKPNFNYEDKWIISEDSIQWTQSKIASYNPAQKLFKCAECDCVGYLHRVTEHWLGTHSNLRAFQCPQCPYESAWARCVRIHLSRQHNINSEEATDILLKNNPVVQEISRYLQCLKTRLETTNPKSQNNPNNLLDDVHSASTLNGAGNPRIISSQASSSESMNTTSNSNKRYNCTYCPYATDRRDLFTRHENIHREEKPFQCYVCQKQFNRADHVKKHFLRMHREHPYDLNRIRRHPPKNSSGMSFYQKYNSNMATNDIQDSVASNLSLNNPLSIPNNFNPRSINNMRSTSLTDMKTNCFKSSMMSTKTSGKKKGEKRFTCCYCTWSGVDNWCLKRHMNTHLKPFVCSLCDYKAARSERLATHVLKVHNKRACGKCNYLADDSTQLAAHQQEHHPLEQRNNRNNSTSSNTSTRNGIYLNGSASALTQNSFNQSSQATAKPHEYGGTPSTSFMHHTNRLLPADCKPWKTHAPKQHGAARLFSYMEASDGSEPECDSHSAEDMNRIGLSQRLQSDFPEAGDVGMALDEIEGEDMELPLFVCATCGCEFEDDRSLETHQYTHHHRTTSPAKFKESKDVMNRRTNYRCCVCEATFISQHAVMVHMQTHTNLNCNTSNTDSVQDKENQSKRSRKQSQPKKISVPFGENNELDLQINGKTNQSTKSLQLVEKYVMKLIKRKRYTCNLCSNLRVFQFSTKARLVIHQYWKHNKNRFECEHCSMQFRHRYQVVLHSSREHINTSQNKPFSDKDKTVVPLKECFGSNETLPDESHNFFHNTFTSSSTDTTNSSVHKLGMTLFDHSFLHTNSGINNHMPLIIPTFPPN